MAGYNRSLFLNIPFDRRYEKLKRALVFTTHLCGLRARCALERDNGGQVRFDKIKDLIENCRYGIHDLSRTTLDPVNRLPRFNMPLELGVFLGAARFGDARQRQKSCLILDSERYRYQKFCSDLAGSDIRAHGNRTSSAIRSLRDWLQTELSWGARLRSAKDMEQRYLDFTRMLPGMCRDTDRNLSDLTFVDYRELVELWIERNELGIA